MAWFSRNNQPSVDKEQLLAQQRQVDETIQALENAKLPPYIRRRIAEQRQGSLPWTSTLSVSDMYDTRELAMNRMQKEAHDDKAEGVVGVQLSERSHGWDSHVIEFFSVGTAVTPTRDDHVIESANLILSLND